MKKINRSLHDELRRGDVKLCKCWAIILDDGTTFGFTEHDKTLTVDSVPYEPTNAFSSTAFSQKSDMSVDNISVVALSSDLITEEALQAGKLDGARVRIFYVVWDKPYLGTIPILSAKFGEMTFNDGTFETELRSLLQALQQTVGEVYGLECSANLGDSRCRVDLTPWTFTGTVSGGFSPSSFVDYDRAEADDFFQYGTVEFTSGQNLGWRCEVRGYKLGTHMVILLENAPYPIETGDTYNIVAGCDKTCDTCRVKFNNLLNMRGFPHMPTEQTVTETPNAKSGE